MTMVEFNGQTLEMRHCFKQAAHTQHKWHDLYWCHGAGIDPTSQKVNEVGEGTDAWAPAPPVEMDETQRLLEGRVAVYGDRVQNMERVALIWSGVIGHEISAEQVCLMFMAYKIYRASITPDYSDNYDDILGYGRMFEEVVEANGGMVKAVTVDEYLKKKWARDHQPNQSEGQIIEAFMNHATVKPIHPYANVERDDIRDMGPDEHSDLL